MDSYDLIVIGSGTAAQVAVAKVRAAGWSVAVIDHRPFGGACAPRSCDPKKMLVSGEEVIDAARRMAGHGVDGALAIDWPGVMAFKQSFTDPVQAKQERTVTCPAARSKPPPSSGRRARPPRPPPRTAARSPRRHRNWRR